MWALGDCFFLFWILLLAIGMPGVVLFSRFYFGGYIRRLHPEKWKEIKAQTTSHPNDFMTPHDVNMAMWRFRTRSNDDLGDPDVQRRRVLTKRVHLACIIAVPTTALLGALFVWLGWM